MHRHSINNLLFRANCKPGPEECNLQDYFPMWYFIGFVIPIIVVGVLITKYVAPDPMKGKTALFECLWCKSKKIGNKVQPVDPQTPKLKNKVKLAKNINMAITPSKTAEQSTASIETNSNVSKDSKQDGDNLSPEKRTLLQNLFDKKKQDNIPTTEGQSSPILKDSRFKGNDSELDKSEMSVNSQDSKVSKSQPQSPKKVKQNNSIRSKSTPKKLNSSTKSPLKTEINKEIVPPPPEPQK